MTDRDPAFLWETEALRSAAHRIVEAEIDADIPPPVDGNWMTLREANRATGIPVETLRKWARRSTIPTYLTPSNRGTSIRMIDLNGVTERAEQLGRVTVKSSETKVADVATSPAEPSPPPPGTMIVPVDAWNKMLNQLGNLHEAGQQLAVAKERAAKAETEAKFLRERLAEIRHGEAPAPEPPPPPVAPGPAFEPPPEKVWQFFVRSLRGRKSG
jgi:hypothetical protein